MYPAMHAVAGHQQAPQAQDVAMASAAGSSGLGMLQGSSPGVGPSLQWDLCMQSILQCMTQQVEGCLLSGAC